jgi:hypothetical protein
MNTYEKRIARSTIHEHKDLIVPFHLMVVVGVLAYGPNPPLRITYKRTLVRECLDLIELV